jgi:xanthine dehydrogenase accessory factor
MVRGGGDLASGVALRLHRAGIKVVITELPRPLTVRRAVAFSEAVYRGHTQVEEVTGILAVDVEDSSRILSEGNIPVLVDPQADSRHTLTPIVLVDARMTKRPPDLGLNAAKLVVGLGPGFLAGENCHAVIETQRGHSLGRVIWNGAPQPDTGVPEAVRDHQAERVLRAPEAGILVGEVEIADHVEAGQLIARVGASKILAPFSGVVRGLLHSGLSVTAGMKIGDVDPRDDPSYCFLVSDKSLAIGGGVLEAILSRPDIRGDLWS